MKPPRMSRRELAGAVLSTAATAAAAQTPPSTPPAPDGELQAARERNRRTSETLAAAWTKAKAPIETEPAFHFTA